MDDSMDDFLDAGAGSGSDFDGGAKPKAKAKAKPGPKAGAKKATAPKAKAAPKKTQTTVKKAAPKKRKQEDSDDENDSPDEPSFNDNSLLSVTPPSTKKQKKAPVAKKGKPLAEVENDAINLNGSPEATLKAIAASAEDSSSKYQMLTQLEHILKRPDTYIGSIERQEQTMWVFNSEKEQMEMRKVTFNPGLYKIFDEILVNAADNKQNDKNMDTIKVTVSRETGEISVLNNGRGIPIEMHTKKGIYIPEMIFGNLLTSSNYNDEEAKITGGRNGYGAKLCNIYSSKFSIETADERKKQRYRQTWTDNMTKMQPASITSNKGDDYTKVTFIPDYARFRMEGIDDDFEALVKRRVYDIAGTVKGVKVYLNGQRVPVKNFKSYMELYVKGIKEERGDEAANDRSEIITDTDKERWEIGFAVSDGSFQQVSFVNSIATTSGGTHVNYIADQICNKLVDVVKKRNKAGASLKPAQIRNHLFVFVNSHINNPAFTSQTKEQMTTRPSQFGSKFQVSDEFLKKLTNKTDVISNILAFAEKKADQILKKSDGSRRSRMDNPKLVDANKAGTKFGEKCTLILIEGDSAKGLAMTGRSIVGPDWFGVFPLRGKLLNVRDASIDQISKNQEIQNIKNILGLKHRTEYTDCKSLRYGHIMIMTDQDHDGSHIKGLLINFLQVQYPSLLKIPGFLIEFITPIVKVYKGDPKAPRQQKTFFNMPEYDVWKELHQHERGWEHKYYKGLGTSSDADARKYFEDLDKHLKQFHAMRESEPALIELAFSKKRADDRKEWLRQFTPGTYLDHTEDRITYDDFINKELILFSMADNVRSIPSVVDGFKPGQRKVMYACFKRNLRKDIKVVELAGYVSGITAYQHGEASLQQTIIGLAQTFVGSNNVNCLEPSGNFGSRLQGGSDAASARYIYTRLSPFARRVFHPLDDPLLKYNTDDDKTIEPEVYVPVVPMVLINGADGIGTGWSTSIPNYSPVEIVENLKRLMRGEDPKEMTPWFKNWGGTTEQVAPDRYKFSGRVEQDGNDAVITELPIRLWTDDFKARIVDVIKSDKIVPWIKDYEDYNTKTDIHFVIHMEEKHMKKALEEGLEERFKLAKTIATSNLVAFDGEGRLTRYKSPEDMLKEFYLVRLKVYQKRRAYMLDEYNKELRKLSNQARFVSEIVDGKLKVGKKSKKLLVSELQQRGYEAFPKKAENSKESDGQLPVANEESEDEETEASANDYDYLLGMPIWSLTKERYERLLRQVGDKEAQIDALLGKTVEDLWNADLDDFLAEWELQLLEEKDQEKKARSRGRRVSSKLKTQIGSKAAKKRKGDDSDSDFDFGSKKKGGKSKEPSGIVQHLKSFAPEPAATKPAAKPKATQSKLNFSAASKDSMDLDGAVETSKAKEAVKNESDDDDDFDEFAMKPAKTSTTATRAPRTAARKITNYSKLGSDDDDDDESDNGDDLLADVGSMVKGIGETATAAAATSAGRTLFSNPSGSSRPNSSAGNGLKKTTTTTTKDKSAEETADETDYHQLIASAKGNRIKPISLGNVDDDGMSMDEMDGPIPVKPTVVKAPAKRGPKAGAKATAKATTATKASATTAPLSAAAKAYAAKQAKSTSSSSRKAKEDSVVKDDDDEDDDEDDSIMPAPRGRPGRAAAAKKKYAVAYSDEDSDDFDDGDSD